MSDQFEVTLIWMHDNELVPGRSYYLKLGSQLLAVTLAKPKYKIDVETNEHLAAKTLLINEIGVTVLTVDRNIPFAPYTKNKELGGFILIDKFSNQTLGAGLIKFALRRAQNIHWYDTDISRYTRAAAKNQKPAVLWMTGLSGSGKSTIANAVEKKLHKDGYHTYLLDGDNIRHGLNKDLGFTESDRIENIRRIGEVAKLMADAGLIVITAFISPFQSDRDMVRGMINDGEFIEIFIDTPMAVAEKRDVKGLYAKARAGKLSNFTGIDSPYEEPTKPDIVIDTSKLSIDDAASKIFNFYCKLKYKNS
jgi:bifunctional enzyme CysN/CysC